MNAWVKVFIVINLVLSALWSAFTMVLYTNRQDWKEQYHTTNKARMDLQNTYEEYKKEKENLLKDKEREIDGFKKDFIAADSARNELADDKVRLEKEILEIKKKVDEKEAELAKLHDNFNKKSDELRDTQLAKEKAQEEAQSSRTIRIDLQEQIVSHEKERSQLIADLSLVKGDKEKLENDLKQKEWTLKKLRERGIDISEIIAGAAEPDVPIHAKVLAVQPNVNVVLISVGKGDKVKEGYRFTVYRGGTYIGKVQVESVYPSYASARILTDLVSENQQIQEGDSASTRVY